MTRLRPHAAPIAVAALTVVGLVLRVELFGESLLADELSTRWIVSTNGLAGVWSTVHTDAEITPPLFFVLSWFGDQLYDAPEMVRLPSLVAGLASIPLMYLLGLRTIGRPAATTAAAVVALSPFTIYYSTEARGYAVLILLVALSTLSMLLALDTRSRAWWIVYAVASCGAMYTHYTAAFALLAQLGWLFWAHPEARRAALIANVAAAIGYLPWLSGLLADLDSPTTEILSALSPFDTEHVRVYLTHATVGYPYDLVGLRELPGIAPVILFVVGVLLGARGLVASVARRGVRPSLEGVDRRIVLVVALAVAVPLGTALVSLVGTNLFSTRNLAASWPGYALSLGALLVAAGPRLRYGATACVLVCLTVGALDLAFDDSTQRPNFKGLAEYVDEEAGPDDVVIDGAVLSPGPYSPMDIALGRPHPMVRFQAPVQRTRPFGVFDHVVPREQVMRRAARDAPNNRLFVVYAPSATRIEPELFPPGYRMAERRTFSGNTDLRLEIWGPP